MNRDGVWLETRLKPFRIEEKNKKNVEKKERKRKNEGELSKRALELLRVARLPLRYVN